MCPRYDHEHFNKPRKHSCYSCTLYLKSWKAELSIYKQIIKNYINNNRCYTSNHRLDTLTHLSQTSRINLCKRKRNKTDKHYMKIIKSIFKRFCRVNTAVIAMQIQTYHFLSAKNKSYKSANCYGCRNPDF